MEKFQPPPLSPSRHFPLTVSISLPALAHNVTTLQRLLPSPCRILAVVKADAYGHGAPVIAKTLAHLAVSGFGVATVHEGVTLRQHGVRQPIVIMGGLLPDVIPELLRERLTPVIADRETAIHLARHVKKHERAPYPVHLKIDTGMRRLGFAPDEALSWLSDTDMTSCFHIQGLMTHLADADNPDPTYTQDQLHRLQTFILELKKGGITIPLVHAANSAAIIQHPSAHLDMVRPGLALYGYSPVPFAAPSPSLKPIMTVSTAVVHLHTVPPGEMVGYNGFFRTTRPTRLAVLPIGYSHGLSRRLSSRGNVLIQGRRVPIVGKICMDMIMVDVTGLPTVALGDPVVILGRQGEEEISAHELAEWQDTIPYEVLCTIGSRGYRLYDPLKDQSLEEENGEPQIRFPDFIDSSLSSR